ncbi:hypothetical protein [Modicisalibacter luteus]|uniref:Uncharacterized protein n=1 Tax=Modicisalibacter luteus TaxID=453962 RepID=A0ABV7M3L6_9GAMM|nr:hypothetical protein [Halomonas lutea]GHA85252.1 hypothetical protein GCM10007159_02920 [Halomonas lutea]
MQTIAVPIGNEVRHGAFMDHLQSGALDRQQGTACLTEKGLLEAERTMLEVSA